MIYSAFFKRSFISELITRSFYEVYGNTEAKLALLLNFIDPKCGGVIIAGKRGTGKSTLLQAFKNLLEASSKPSFYLPTHITEENLLGGLDLEETLTKGEPVYEEGLLEKARGGYLIVDDLHLMPPGCLALLFEKIDSYTLVAALNSEEGGLSSHYLNKVGLFVVTEEFSHSKARVEALKDIFKSKPSHVRELLSRLEIARGHLKSVDFDHSIWDYITQVVSKFRVRSHRGEIFLLFAARALASLMLERNLKKEIVDIVAPLVLSHRSSLTEEKVNFDTELKQEENRTLKTPRDEKKITTLTGDERGSSQWEDPNFFENLLRNGANPLKDSQLEKVPSVTSKEETFALGKGVEIKNLLVRCDRIRRKIAGKRTNSKTYLKGGIFIRSVEDRRFPEVDLLGTIKRAAPHQSLRGGEKEGKLVIQKEDLRYKERERKLRHLVVFVVDASGSQGVLRRMEAVKGAIVSLLSEAYKKRDKVALIMFRKFGAELLIPPTKSPQSAYRTLKEITIGGNTPLSAGLWEAYKLIRRYHGKNPQSRVILVLVTDGKANIPIIKAEDPLEEVKRICYQLRELPYVDTLVLDTEIKSDYPKMDLARDIASWLGASYHTLEALPDDGLIRLIRSRKYF